MVLQIDDEGVPLHENGEVLGKVLPLFDYSKKNVVTHKDWLKAFADTFTAPNSLSDSKAGSWIDSPRLENQLFMEDDMRMLKGLGGKSKSREKLCGMNIKTVDDLVKYFHMNVARRKKLCEDHTRYGFPRVSKAFGQTLMGQAGTTLHTHRRY